jgi:hypothetical protein
MAATLSSINTDFQVPDLPADATPQQSLEFEKKIMEFNIRFQAADTGIKTIGNAEHNAVRESTQ